MRTPNPDFTPGTPVTLIIGDYKVTGRLATKDGDWFMDPGPPTWGDPKPPMGGHFIAASAELEGGGSLTLTWPSIYAKPVTAPGE